MPEYELIPEGRYRARADKTDADEAIGQIGEKETPFILIYFTILSGPYEGRSVRYRGFLTSAALPYTLDALRAMGFKGNDISDLSGIGSVESSITIKHESWENENGEMKTYANVNWVNSIGGVTVNQIIPPAQKRNLFEQLKGDIAALDASSGANAEDDLDDINF